MMTKEENERLTQVGPETPMGRMLRRYWVPALVSSELPMPACPPVRVRLLGEDLVAFRSPDGELGMVQQACAHRGASLFWGCNEEGGIRCAYHGWKYDRHGQCIDMPSEPPSSRFKDRIRIAAYPTRERGGVIWTYMGPPELEPGLPELEWCLLPESHVAVNKRIQECNWVQILEGNADPVHVAYLHQRFATEFLPEETLSAMSGTLDEMSTREQYDEHEIVPTPYGRLLGMRRPTREGEHAWKTTHWIMPWYGLNVEIPGLPYDSIFYTPIDDETTMFWVANFRSDRPLDDQDRKLINSGMSLVTPAIPGTFLNAANRSNDYLIDRSLQSEGYRMPIHAVGVQDLAIQESQGRIFDRTKENLGTSDLLIVRKRRALLEAMEANERGEVELPGLDPSTHHVRSANVTAPRDVPFEEAVAKAIVADSVGHA